MNTIHQSTFRLTLLLIGIAFLFSCAPIPGDVSDEITEANNRFMVAFNSGDAELMAESYTDAGKLLPPNGDEVVGKEAIQDFWQGGMDMGLSKVELVTVEAIGYGNTAVEEGRYTIFTEGNVEVDHGKYVVIWQKEMGQWKLHKDIWNSSHPAPIARAMENDTVWVIMNKVKPGMVDQFEEFNFNILEPAAAENYPHMRNTVRTLRPVDAEEDGSWTYIYLIDPVASPDGYDMMIPLTAKYGKEQALEYAGMFTECLKDGKQHWVVTVQSGW